MNSSFKKISNLHKKVAALDFGTDECNEYFSQIGLDNPSERELTFYRVALLAAALEVQE